MFQITFELRGTTLGVGTCHSALIHAQLQEPPPVAHFCPECGEIWGRTHVLPQKRQWIIDPHPCLEHGDGDFGDWHWFWPAIFASEDSALLRYQFIVAHNRQRLGLYNRFPTQRNPL